MGASPATFDYAKLDWMNGVYLRAMSGTSSRSALVTYLGEQGSTGTPELVGSAAPIVQEKIARLGEFPGFAGFLFHDVEPDPAQLDAEILAAAAAALERRRSVDGRPSSRQALKALCETLGRKPREVYPPIRVAVTGSRISPGLYESLELLGGDVALERLRRGEQLASGS